MNHSPSPYDAIAGMYHRLWADWYLPAALPALEQLFFSQIPSNARVLDLCCGSGHVTRELVRRGCRTTGVDLSVELIRQAREDLPAVDLLVGDVRDITFKPVFDAILSTFDSLNHVVSLEELRAVFSNVSRSLAAGGLFVFDMNLEEAYFADLQQWAVTVKDDSVTLVRGTYDTAAKLASTELMWFAKHRNSEFWTRRNSIVQQRCYTQSEILMALNEGGFLSVESVPAPQAGVSAELGFGRIFFVATKRRGQE